MKKVILTTVLVASAIIVAVVVVFADDIKTKINHFVGSTNILGEVKGPILIQDQDITWYQDQAKQYNLVIFDQPLEFYFSPTEAQSVKEQVIENDLRLAVNGSFYIGSYIQAQHAGLLQIKGELIEDYVQNVQLTHVIAYNHDTNQLQFVRGRDFKQSEFEGDEYTLVQTGPLVVEKNQLQTEFINGSLNGQAQAFRTLLGYTNGGKIFLLTTRSGFNLKELVSLLLENPLFKDQQLTIINLDGGASTSMYSRDFEQFRFREDFRLPLIIGIK
jgi:exopolysaccharide biosynthesis protein